MSEKPNIFELFRDEVTSPKEELRKVERKALTSAVLTFCETLIFQSLDKLRVLDFEGGDWGDAESIHTISVSGPLSSVSGLLNSVSDPLILGVGCMFCPHPNRRPSAPPV